MKIVLVIDHFDNMNNGTTISAHRYAARLRNRGHKVTILAGGLPRENKIAVPTKRLPFFQKLVDKQGFSFAKADDETYYQAFKDADIVHFYLPTTFCRRGEKIARQMKVPTIAAFHLQPENITYSIGLGHNKRVNQYLYRYFYRTFYRHFNYIHCPSQFIANQLQEHGYQAELCVISNGVDDLFKPQVTKRPQALEDKFIILMIGRLSGEKRQDLIIRATLLSKYKNQIQLVFAGKGPKEAEYKHLGKVLPNQPIFGFYSQDELLKLINYSDLYIHASDAEIEGISCLEAIACGLVPIISDSKLSATNEFALTDRCLFRAGDPRSLADRIDYWIEHPQEKAELGLLYAAKGNEMRVDNCIYQAEEMYRKAIENCCHKKILPLEETWLDHITHPQPDKVNALFYEASKLRRLLFALFTNFLALIFYLINFLVFGFRLEGKNNLPEVKGGAVTVLNHVHPLDCTMVKLAVFPRRIYFTTLRQNLELPFIGWLVKICGGLPLPNEKGKTAEFFKQLKQSLQRGDWIHFYPEGLLVRYHKGLRDFQKGAFFTAVHSNAPVIPMRLVCVKTYGPSILNKHGHFSLLIGKPQYPNLSLSTAEAIQELTDRTWQVMNQLENQVTSEEKWNLYSFARLACILLLVIQLLRKFANFA